MERGLESSDPKDCLSFDSSSYMDHQPINNRKVTEQVIYHSGYSDESEARSEGIHEGVQASTDSAEDMKDY